MGPEGSEGLGYKVHSEPEIPVAHVSVSMCVGVCSVAPREGGGHTSAPPTH